MKNLILCISLLALTGCSNPFSARFKVGDCIVFENTDRESWEVGYKDVEKVLEVGKNKYRLLYMDKYLKGEELEFNNIRSVDRIFEKTECPNEQ